MDVDLGSQINIEDCKYWLILVTGRRPEAFLNHMVRQKWRWGSSNWRYWHTLRDFQWRDWHACRNCQWRYRDNTQHWSSSGGLALASAKTTWKNLIRRRRTFSNWSAHKIQKLRIFLKIIFTQNTKI